MATSLAWGPTPSREGVTRIDELMAAARTRRGRALVAIDRAMLLAFLGRFDEARSEMEAARTSIDEGTGGKAVWSNMGWAEIPLAEGDLGRAIDLLTAGRANLQEVGDTGTQSTVEGILSVLLAMVGRDREAVEMSDEAERHASSDDFASQIRLHTGRGLALAHLGRLDEGLLAISSALETARQTDHLNGHADALHAQAEVLHLAGRDDEAARARADSIDLYRRKENLAALRRLGVPVTLDDEAATT
jgi:tetratricopeptide (TPR) repeat protein